MSRQITALSAAITLLTLALPATAQAGTAVNDTTVQAEQHAPEVPPAEVLIASLDQISPLQLVRAVSEYWQRGDKLQASFWYYIWQIRTAPWVGTDPAFDDARASLNNAIGQTINGWIAADSETWQATARRAVAFEPKLPLWTIHPPEMSPEAWATRVAEHRASYARELDEAFAQTDAETIRRSRSEAGLPVGPLTDAGQPLPDAWR